MRKNELSRGLRNNNEEEWRDIPGYEGLYSVSSLGRVKSLPKYHAKHSIILNGFTDKDGYICVTLCPNSRTRKRHLVHRLVAVTFLDNPNNLPEVDHINTVRSDNMVSNLRWATRSSNQLNDVTRIRLAEKMKGKLGRLNSKSIPILQCDLDGNIIRRWDNPQEYKRYMNLRKVDGIYKCIKGELKTSMGYIWKRV